MQQDFFQYFAQDTRRTFPVPTEAHTKEILEALSINTTFDNYEADLDDGKIGALMHNFREIVNTGVYADVIKAAIFYGKYKDFEFELEDFMKEIPNEGEFAVGPQAVELLHSLLGIVSESAELAKAIMLGIMNDQKFDVVNLKEEYGDVVVYAQAGLNAIDLTLKDAMDANVAKRAKRFPNGFTQFDAVNRDIQAERVILEGQQ